MKRKHFIVPRKITTVVIAFTMLFSFGFSKNDNQNQEAADKEKQKVSLELILKVLPPDQLNENSSFDDRGRVSYLDRTFTDWLERTGELPPDFERMPSLPFLPDPLVLDEGGKNIPVKTMKQWEEKREWMKKQLQYYIKDIALLASARPSWLHPRLRFFIGNEHKLPVDQNSFMALIAPRGLMLSTALTEGASNIWAIEQAYHASRKVYDFLDAGENLGIRTRYGEHGVSARDMEDYIDFFDFVFNLSDHQPDNRMYCPYSFQEWTELSSEKVNPHSYPKKSKNTLNVNSISEWENQKGEILQQINWVLGDEPPG